MRIPKVFESKLDSNEIQIQNLKLEISPIPYYTPTWQDDEKDYIKLIKKIEKIIRTSYEYKNYVKFLKEEIDMNCCSFFKNLSREDISIEIHHSPLTLFELTTIVFSKQIDEVGADNVNIYDVAEEVTKLHYDGLVGLIPLSLTAHQLVHRGDLFIPINCVYGKVKEFYKNYKPYFTEEQIQLLKNHINTTKQLDNENYRPSILERKFTYVDVDGMVLPKRVEVKNIETNKEVS